MWGQSFSVGLSKLNLYDILMPTFQGSLINGKEPLIKFLCKRISLALVYKIFISHVNM